MAYKGSRVDKVLENVSLGYFPTGFICNNALTPLPVPKRSGHLASYGDAHLRYHATRVFDRGGYNVVPTIDRNTDKTYLVHNHGLKDIVTEDDIEEVEKPFQAEADVTIGLRNILYTEKELTVANLFRAAANYASGNSVTLTSTTQFNDYTNSNPLVTINTAQTRVWEESGVRGDCAIIPYNVMLVLRYHPRLANVYGQRGTFSPITDEQIKAVFKLRELHIPDAHYVNNAGNQVPFWGKDIIIYNRATSAMRRQRTLGYMFQRRGREHRVFKRESQERPNSMDILSDMSYSYSFENNQCGYVIKSAIA